MEPLVSTRISLRWPPAAAEEHEDVLVVQGRSGFFLDLRVRRVAGQDRDFGGLEQSLAGETDVTWATAGWKSLLPPRNGEEHPRARFDAVLDSRSPAFSPHPSSSAAPPPPDGATPDEGSFEKLSNGDVLERGEMLNPMTGTVQQYEEVWRRLPLLHDEGGGVRVLVLELVDEAEKGCVGRVGDWEVGLLDSAAGFGVVRREKRAGEWAVVYQNGAGAALPSLEGVQAGEKGSIVQLGGRTWQVVESS
ncbi:hypothetical protein JCM10213_003647 [Rhodosporidiobolus nylandii]